MPVIEVSDLRKVYDSQVVVDGVSFSVEPGEIFGVLGPKGAGKTTMWSASGACASVTVARTASPR